MNDGQIGEELLLANESVRVWQDRVAPGESQPLHTHRHPYLSIFVSGGTGVTLDEGGAVLSEVDRQPGDVRWFPDVPLRHTMRNTGDAEMLVVIVELLQP